MSKSTERGQDFLRGIAAKVTDPAVKTALEGLASHPDVLQELGAGALRQDEFSSQMDRLRTEEQALQTWRSDLTTWHATEKAKLDADRAAIGTKPTDPPPPATPPHADLDGLKSTVQQLANAAPLVMADMTAVGLEHFQRFNEPLDLQALIRHPKAGELGVRGVYELLHADRLKAYHDARVAAETNKLRETIRAEEVAKLRQQNTTLPYPVGGEGDIVSPLDALEQPKAGDTLPVGHPDRILDTFYKERAGAAV